MFFIRKIDWKVDGKRYKWFFYKTTVVMKNVGRVNLVILRERVLTVGCAVF
ncbi:unnamed protein product [marine sediment metagenome]|uniref:Uncharacterized protein n=1 Tax=marine sediment metagenome TaxID=412755 RepID=X1NRY8_9ZZZZ